MIQYVQPTSVIMLPDSFLSISDKTEQAFSSPHRTFHIKKVAKCARNQGLCAGKRVKKERKKKGHLYSKMILGAKTIVTVTSLLLMQVTKAKYFNSSQ